MWGIKYKFWLFPAQQPLVKVYPKLKISVIKCALQHTWLLILYFEKHMRNENNLMKCFIIVPKFTKNTLTNFRILNFFFLNKNNTRTKFRNQIPFRKETIIFPNSDFLNSDIKKKNKKLCFLILTYLRWTTNFFPLCYFKQESNVKTEFSNGVKNCVKWQ